MIDPRLDIIRKRLDPVRRILVFAGAKGGVGKSFCTAVTAVELARRGLHTAVLDMDFQGASAHLFLGAELGFPEEEAGIKPLRVGANLELMSFAAFSGERAVPLRGEGVREAMLELLAITIWPPLDFLLVDMPPGIGDELLDLLRYLHRGEFVVVATGSRVVVQVVSRLLELLRSLDAPLLGVVENMTKTSPQTEAKKPPQTETKTSPQTEPAGMAGGGFGEPVESMCARFDTTVLARLPFVPDLDSRLPLLEPLDGTLGREVRALADALTRGPAAPAMPPSA